MKKEMNETVNNANAFASHTRARKLDLGTIAQIMENDSSTGFISKDLYDALKMADAAGLCAEDKPLPEFLQWEDRKLDYNAEKLSKEADVTLLLRAKAGDKEATEKLFKAKESIIKDFASKLTSKYGNVSDILEHEFDSFLSVVNEAFMVHIIQHPICAQGRIMFSHSNLELIVNETINDGMLYTTASGKDVNLVKYIHKINRRMKACDIDIKNVSQAQYIDFCLRKKICNEETAKMAYAQQANAADTAEIINGKSFGGGRYILESTDVDEANPVDSMMERIAADSSQTPFLGDYTNYYNFNPENIAIDNSDFIEIIQKIRIEHPEYERDIATLFAHVLGDAHFDFKKIMAEDADDNASLKKTAEVMGYESAYDVKLAKKRARELVFKTISREYPELFSDITRDIAKVKAI